MTEELRPVTAADIRAALNKRRAEWGAWTYDPKTFTLVHDDGGSLEYYIPLSECIDAARILDWIAQVATKTWAEPATIGHLVRAFNDVLRLQENVCSMGRSAEIDPAAVATARGYLAGDAEA